MSHGTFYKIVKNENNQVKMDKTFFKSCYQFSFQVTNTIAKPEYCTNQGDKKETHHSEDPQKRKPLGQTCHGKNECENP